MDSLRTTLNRHPEVLGAMRRASKDDDPGAPAASFEGRFAALLRMTVNIQRSRDASAPEFC
jgi:hypothetical protein